MPRIAVVGSANMDLVVQCDALPRMGETVIGKGFSKHPGGKGANQAVAAGRLTTPETEVFFIGCVGNDDHGMDLLKSLTESKVNLAFCRIVDGARTGIAVITVDGWGNNTIVVDSGANGVLTGQHVTDSLRSIDPDVVLVQLEVPDEAVYACAGHGRLILDPAPARHLEEAFLQSVDVVTPNENEAHSLTGMAIVNELAKERAARSLLEKGAKNVVLTLGKDGVFWSSGSEQEWWPSSASNVVDSTAAGDAFCGALAVFMAEGLDLKVAIERANSCAGVSVSRHGAQGSMPWRDEVDFLDEI
jgi:ribokinase